MPAFETFACEHCGSEFRAHPSANAAQAGYWSPACEIEGKDLA